MFQRLQHFVKEADRHTKQLPHKRFHQLINRGLLGLYLSDEKVRKQQNIRKLAKEILKTAGPASDFFYFNAVDLPEIPENSLLLERSNQYLNFNKRRCLILLLINMPPYVYGFVCVPLPRKSRSRHTHKANINTEP